MSRDLSSEELDRRRGARVSASLRVFYQHRGEAWLVEAQTENLSSEGVFVRTTKPPLAVGTDVVVSMALEDGEPLMVRGQVTWTRNGADEQRGMGLRFTDLGESGAAAIARFLARRDEQTG